MGVTIYLLTSTISGPIYGKLSDLYGRRPIFIWARSALFLVASVLAGCPRRCGSSSSSAACRAWAVAPSSRSPRGHRGPVPARGAREVRRAVRCRVRAVVGPRAAIGGIITDTFGWPWIFFVNVPLGLISLFICWRLLPRDQAPGERAQHRLRRRGPVHGRHRADPRRPDQQAVADWTDPWVGGLILIGLASPLRLHVVGVAGRWTRSSRSACSATGPSPSRWPACSWPPSASSARSSSCRTGSRPSPGEVPPSRAEPAAAGLRADRQRHAVRPDRGPNRLQAAHLRGDGHPGGRAVPDDQPSRRH